MSIFFQRSFQSSFGTYPLSGEAPRSAVLAAAEAGYRSFDTAQMYGNEPDIGAARRETGIPRDELLIARGEVFRYPLFDELGNAHGRTAGQIVLRWVLQKGVTINTMSTKPDHIRANFDVMDFTLSSIDMARIDALRATNQRIVRTFRYAPEWDRSSGASRFHGPLP